VRQRTELTLVPLSFGPRLNREAALEQLGGRTEALFFGRLFEVGMAACRCTR
jgi:hypothetical protein